MRFGDQWIEALVSEYKRWLASAILPTYSTALPKPRGWWIVRLVELGEGSEMTIGILPRAYATHKEDDLDLAGYDTMNSMPDDKQDLLDSVETDLSDRHVTMDSKGGPCSDLKDIERHSEPEIRC